MNAALIEQPLTDLSPENNIEPCFSSGEHPTVLSDIYQKHVNIAIWQRNHDEELTQAVSYFLNQNKSVRKSLTLTPENAYEKLEYATDGTAPKVLLENMVELVDMYCYLFDIKQVGLRLATLDSAMCPRFHVDKVPCRLVSTYHGIATQWIPNHVLDRSKLGHGSNGQPDSTSGLYRHETDIQQVTCGDVALLKGELWIGNENLGLVHRSPAMLPEETRLLLTLDFG